ncbi:cytochrome c [Marivita sp. XM-24bin2]|jgi:mono/diheme cytochrome c family protein|uniref:cytochrome c n=1 Tax=unclassified Marivita TaxID=2632480 RepID=UPI000D7AE3DB|nr:cytochrome c [Marivita sp. XM-24bin2]MCR9108052.1 c-type cytochrome [Paracoccaceae bacterium]PWL33932.1 MAG: diacylglycerol kinase [Marivita sp. XM-24bin2]
MRRGLIVGGLCLAAIVAAGLFVTRAVPVDASAFDGLEGDAANGEKVFTAAGCASCHAAPDATGEAKVILAGGQRFDSDFGTFIAPNISPHPEAGIGSWSLGEFASAVQKGVSPDGQHYYPAFPYASYIHMTDQDVVDLWAFWQTLPEDATPSQPQEVNFPFSIRRSVGVWKYLYLTDDWVMQDVPKPELERGRYLVEALAHCGECHTPRDALGGLDRSQWLAGAANPTGPGQIPSLTPDDLGWGPTDIVYYLETGFTPDFDSAGGHMVSVIENFAKLPASDREAVAAYLKALP